MIESELLKGLQQLQDSNIPLTVVNAKDKFWRLEKQEIKPEPPYIFKINFISTKQKESEV